MVPSAYSDDLGYISMASSTSDVMNSVISAGAIINAFSDNGACGFLSSDDKETVSHLVYGATIYPEVRDLTVDIVYSIFYNLLLDPALSRYDSSNVGKVQRCLVAIIEKHNAIVRDAERQKQELQSAEWKKGKIFTSEQEYNDTLRAKGMCDYENVTTGITFTDYRNIRTLNECKKYCRDFATSNACSLEYVIFSRKDGVPCECLKTTEGIRVFSKNPYFFIPTWEDYKKLYNMKYPIPPIAGFFIFPTFRQLRILRPAGLIFSSRFPLPI